jgi:hypothetical protein
MVKKATGLGITEFFLRLMAWLCLKDNSLSGSYEEIILGDIGDLGDRVKDTAMLFLEFFIYCSL